MEQLGSIFVVASNEQGNTKGSTHNRLLALGTLAEAQGEIADGLGSALDAKGLVEVEGVALALYAGVLDHGAGVGLEAGHGAANMAVDLDNLLYRGCLKEGRCDSFLDAENDTLGSGNADGCGAELDGFERVFDLEQTTFGGEGVDPPIYMRVRRTVKLNEAVEESC